MHWFWIDDWFRLRSNLHDYPVPNEELLLYTFIQQRERIGYLHPFLAVSKAGAPMKAFLADAITMISLWLGSKRPTKLHRVLHMFCKV